MRRFITYSLLFLTIISALLCAGEIVCRHYQNPYAYKNEWLQKNADCVATLILGSSVNYYGINPHLLGDSTFNLAGVSQNYEYDYALLKRYFDNTHSLRRIILSLSYTSFTDAPLEQSREWMNAQGYKIYMSIDKHSIMSRYAWEIANFNGYAGKLRNALSGQNSIICDTLGHGIAMPLAAKSSHWVNDVQLTVDRHTASDRSYVSYNTAWLDSIINWTDRHNVETILLSTPRHQLYRQKMPAWQCRLTRHVADSIATTRHIRLIDLSDDPEFGDDDFFDADHLTSDIGADLFTLKLRTFL